MPPSIQGFAHFRGNVLVISTLLLLFFLCGTVGSVAGQCTPPSPPTFTVTAGPGYQQVTYTISGIATSATMEIWDNATSQWYPGGTYYPPGGSWQLGNQSHNSTVTLRSRNNQSGCSSDWVTASATTFDVGYPWLYVYKGFVGGVMIESGPVYPPPGGICVLPTFSTDGVNFTPLTGGPWCQNTQIFVPLSPNVTYYLRSEMHQGLVTPRYATKTVRLAADQDYGNPSCNASVGKPVNVTNGNMFLTQTDYQLPGIGEAINLTRSYNSMVQSPGLFGLGWSTAYDQYLTLIDSKNIRLATADGRATYFARQTTNVPFTGITPGFPGDIVANGDGTYTLTFKDGRTEKFSSTGKLLWQKDRNGNQTTLNYNGSNVLTGITDVFGRTLTVTMGGNGYVSQINDALGNVATYDYFPSTNLLMTVTYPDGSKYKFEYDATSAPGKTLLKTVKDALDNVLETHLYDSQGRATTSEVAGAQDKYTLDYTNSAFTTVTDGLGRVTKYHFDRSDIRTVVKKTEGFCGCGGGGTESTQYFYDAELNLVKIIDALERETTYTYDSNRNVVSMADVLGTQTFTYNSFKQLLTATDRMGGVTTNTYSSTGNLLTSRDALNHTTTLTYTTLGQLQTFKDALNHTTTLSHDSQGRLTQVNDANGKNTNFGYDARARLTSVTNALNQTTNAEYDFNNRLKKIIYPDTNFVLFTYDLAGRRTAVTDPLNHTTNYGYDNAYRLTSITDALSHSTTFGYDLMSNLISQTDALGNITNYEYDDFNRLKKVKYPIPVIGAPRLEENFTYDKLGNVKTRVDTAGRTTSYDYDNANRLIKTTDALMQITQFEYNARSQMTKVIDALNQQYVFTYDPLGRQLSQTRAGTTMSFEYDSVGNRTKRVDYTGRETGYEYDVLNRLKKINYLQSFNGNPPATPILTATYNYDDLSRLISAVNNAGTVAFTYDNRNRLKTETDVFGHVMGYSYDAASRRTLLKLDGANYANYGYDIADRLTSITNVSDGLNVTFGYDNADRLTSRGYPNTVNTTYEYDGMSRLTRLKDVSTTATLFDRQYSYNAANQISQIVEPSLSRTFGYDYVDRLILVTGGASENYVFDSVGNRTSSHRSSTYGYSPFNKLTSTQTATYGFDANGNTVSKSEGNNFWRYGWDYENRLTEASTRKQNALYKYDALGRRVERNLGYGKERTKFTYDGQDVLVDDNAGTLTKYQNGLGVDNKLRTQTGSTVNYFLSDHLGSTNGLTNSTGSLTASIGYDSFGNPTNNTFPLRYQYTGREFDSFAGLQFSRTRFYDPNLGRFISGDPVGFEGGDVNLYGYVWNNPLQFTDPMGFDGWDYWERVNEARWQAEHAALEALEAPIGFVVGFGDNAGLGIPRMIRDWHGVDNVNWDCYSSYNAGGWAGVAVDVATGVGGVTKLGLKVLGRRAITTVPFTQSTLARGQQVHKAYRAGLADDITTFKEFRGIGGIRPDFVDFATKTIYELKPYNPRGIRTGLSQLDRYKAAFENTYGGPWKTVLDLY